MGKHLGDEEFESAMRDIDKDGSGELEFVEFHAWFHQQDAEAAGEGAADAAGHSEEAAADSAETVFKQIESQLASGCVPLPTGVFHFTVTDPATDMSAPEYFSIDTTTTPSSVVRGDPRPKANASFAVTKQELAGLAGQLMKPSQTGEAQALVDGIPVQAPERPPSGKSGKKGQRPSKQKRRAMFFSGVWTPPRPKLSLVGARTSSR